MLTVHKHVEGELFTDSTVQDATKGSMNKFGEPRTPMSWPIVNMMTQIPTDVLESSFGYGRTVSRRN